MDVESYCNLSERCCNRLENRLHFIKNILVEYQGSQDKIKVAAVRNADRIRSDLAWIRIPHGIRIPVIGNKTTQ